MIWIRSGGNARRGERVKDKEEVNRRALRTFGKKKMGQNKREKLEKKAKYMTKLNQGWGKSKLRGGKGLRIRISKEDYPRNINAGG